MRIVKNKNDSNYPYAIQNSWGSVMSCSLEDLEDLAFEIERVLKEKRAEIQIAVKPSQVNMDWFD